MCDDLLLTGLMTTRVDVRMVIGSLRKTYFLSICGYLASAVDIWMETHPTEFVAVQQVLLLRICDILMYP